MRLVVLGANGRTGKHVLEAALADGCDVTAVVRREDALRDVTHDKLKVVVGDPCDPSFLTGVFQGQDAVISTLGGRRPTKAATSVYHRSACAIVAAARQTKVNRVLVTSTALLFPEQPVLGRLLRILVPHVVRSAGQMEDILRSSDLNWTIVRPGFLTDGAQEAFQILQDAAPPHGLSVSRRALARFLVNAVGNASTACTVFGISGRIASQPQSIPSDPVSDPAAQ